MNHCSPLAIAFDLDGTLYPSYRANIRSIVFTLRHFVVVRHFYMLRKEIRQIDQHRDALQQRSREQLCLCQGALLTRRLGGETENGVKILDRVIYQKWERCFRNIRPFRHLKILLSELQRRGIKLGVMSDLPIGQKLKYLGLDDIGWDTVMTSEESGYLKPLTPPFEMLADRLGCEPQRIIYFGNNYKYDIVGAVSAGMTAVHIAAHTERNSLAALTIKNYYNLINRLIEAGLLSE